MSVKSAHPIGAMGQFHEATAYISLVVVDVAIVQRDCAVVNVDATSAGLPAGANMAHQ